MAVETRRILVNSIRSLAPKVGRGESTVRKWVDRDDWPFGRDPRVKPWDVERVRAWAEIHLKPDPAVAYRKKAAAAEAGRGEFADIGPLTKARIQATIERALSIRQRRLLEGGQLHKNEDCLRLQSALVHQAKTSLQCLGRSLRNALEGLDGDGRERLINQRVEEILGELARGMEELAKGNAHG